MRALAVAAIALLLRAGAARADAADVVAAQADCDGATCTFRVTVRHADEGWDHYADSWQVLAPDGRVLATRVLQHPHVGEQPFTRGLPGVRIPAGIESVRVRAHDSVHGFGGREVVVPLHGAGEAAAER